MIIKGEYLFGKQLCEILDLNPEDINELTVHAKAGGIATIQIVRYAKSTEADLIGKMIIDNYLLTPIISKEGD